MTLGVFVVVCQVLSVKAVGTTSSEGPFASYISAQWMHSCLLMDGKRAVCRRLWEEMFGSSLACETALRSQ